MKYDGIQFYINGVELSQCPETQNWLGQYWWNGSQYYTPKVSDFETVPTPNGYTFYTDGSHKDYLYQGALDICVVGTITCNKDLRFAGHTLQGSTDYYTNVDYADARFVFVHTQNWNESAIIKAGQPICDVIPFYGHTHAFLMGTDGTYWKSIYNLIMENIDIMDNSTEIAQLKLQIADLNNKIEQQNAQITMQSNSIAQLQTEVSSQAETIKNKDSVIDQNNQIIAQQHEDMVVYQEEINNLQKGLASSVSLSVLLTEIIRRIFRISK